MTDYQDKSWKEIPFSRIRNSFRILAASTTLIAGLPDVKFTDMLYAKIMGAGMVTGQLKNPSKQKMIGAIVYWYGLLLAEANELPPDHAMQKEIADVLKQHDWIEPFTHVIVRPVTKETT